VSRFNFSGRLREDGLIPVELFGQTTDNCNLVGTTLQLTIRSTSIGPIPSFAPSWSTSVPARHAKVSDVGAEPV
jgi:hypothetical protein